MFTLHSTLLICSLSFNICKHDMNSGGDLRTTSSYVCCDKI